MFKQMVNRFEKMTPHNQRRMVLLLNFVVVFAIIGVIIAAVK